MVTARLLWQQMRYAILISFVAAAFLTPSSDPWNQAIFAAPMIGLYVISIGVAYLAAPRKQAGAASVSGDLKLVFAATVLEQATRARHRQRVPDNLRVLRRTW